VSLIYLLFTQILVWFFSLLFFLNKMVLISNHKCLSFFIFFYLYQLFFFITIELLLFFIFNVKSPTMEVHVVYIDVVVCVQLGMHFKLSFKVLFLLQDLVVQLLNLFLHVLFTFQRRKMFKLLRVLPELVATMIDFWGLKRHVIGKNCFSYLEFTNLSR
jgi:hypothetical protein